MFSGGPPLRGTRGLRARCVANPAPPPQGSPHGPPGQVLRFAAPPPG